MTEESPQKVNPLFKLMNMGLAGHNDDEEPQAKSLDRGASDVRPTKNHHLGFEIDEAGGSSRLESLMNKSPQSETERGDPLEPEVPERADETVTFYKKNLFTGAKEVDNSKSFKMIGIQNRVGIKFNEKSEYYNKKAENNYRAMKQTLQMYLKSQEKKEEEAKMAEMGMTSGHSTKRKMDTKAGKEIQMLQVGSVKL